MQLYTQTFGTGNPLVILHGLFGMSDNWLSLARRFAAGFRVIVPDLRNHGRSPHAEQMDYAVMAHDVAALISANSPGDLIGHSMGGKVAMQLALSEPGLVRKLIVVDIAPKTYPPQHASILAGLKKLNLQECSQRQDVDSALQAAIPDLATRQLLLKNLQRDAADGFRWKFNLSAIAKHYLRICESPAASGKFLGPVLFVRGEDSDYVLDSDLSEIRERFPAAVIETIPGAGHWVHAARPEVFFDVCHRFLKG